MEISDKDIEHYVDVHKRAYKSFLFFCEEVLGLKEDEEIGYKDLNEEHHKLCNLLGSSDWKNVIILTPRYTLKSSIVTVAFALWNLIRDPNYRILIYSDTSTKAEGFLQGIKNHIEGKAPGSKFRFYYPGWESREKWNNSEIVISKREHSYIEPSVDTGGIESTKVGRHYPLIIFDDIVTDINVTTKAQMDKVYDCYVKSLALLNPGGRVILVGTRWSYADCYGRLIEYNKERNNFIEFIRDADTIKPNGELIYADIGLDEKFLNKQKENLSSYYYSCIYKNCPVDSENAIFHSDDFEFYEPHDEFHKNMWITGTCDPAGEGADFTAITVCATDNKMNLYVLDAINERLKPDKIIDTIIRLNYKWGFDKFSIERNFFKGTLEKDFKLEQQKHLSNKHYKPFHIAEDIVSSKTQLNFHRVMSLQPIQQSHRLFLPGRNIHTLNKTFDELVYQMLQFTGNGSKSPHNDLLVSLAFHVDLMHRGGEPEEKPLETNTPAWHLQQDINRLNALQWRLPPKHRRHVVNFLE